ncbi:hypothetical protein PRIPAC_72933 [Pristionchus pacificus]|uniref:Uncharacterized protein n=1 Tax=Pristionchus pacificus TaxID=54126 RepID=A0A2A6CT77_PRIPA|nr:hypothetical protein PRIPAC_72933 [Pristionchus pacificus]|eukprot:PDM81318.1 hypothetical protein PRIPAC_36321 [Pristionchus pacificus]
MSSKYTKKRKSGRDDDTSAEGMAARSRRDERAAREDSDSPPPTKPKKSKKDDGGDAESMSIEETNKLRISLGMAPLETDDGPKAVEDDDDEPVPEGVNVILEDGIKIHHKTADNLGEKKKERELKEKLETAKQKRKVQEKVLKAKKLADDDDDDGRAASWVEKMRKAEEEKKRAEERAKMLDAMDEEFGVSNLVDEQKDKEKRKKAREAMKQRRAQEDAITAGLIVGHSKESFMGGKDQILVLEDKAMVKDPLTGNDDLSSGIAILERSGSSPRRSSLKEQVAVAYCALKKDREILTSESMTESLLAYELKDRVLTGSDSGLLGQDQMKVKKEHGWPTSPSCDALRRTDYRVLDDGDEVLVNPNIADNERHKRNVELKKRKKGKGFDEAYDEYGNAKQSQLLAKYDEELEGEKKSTFRLNEQGGVDLAVEEEEARARAIMEMAGKTLVSLEMDKFKVASEFYTQEEMISFRKPKKNKKERTGRKKLGKALKADDLMPLEEENGGGRDIGSRKTRGRHGSDEEDEQMEDSKVKKEDGEVEGEDDGEGGRQKKGWKKATKGAVDLDALRRLAAMDEEEEESDDDMAPDANLAGVVIDDDAIDELGSELDRARRLKQEQARPEAVDSEANARKLFDLMQQHGHGKVKKEDPDGEEMEVEEYTGPQDGVVCIDSTMEYCRNIGELTSYGITGNRADKDTIDTSKISREEERIRVKREEGLDQFESVQRWKRAQAEKERRKRERKEAGKAGTSRKEDRGGWRGADGEESRVDSDDERDMMEAAERIKEEEDSEDEEEDGEYRNVLGDEADLQKGVGAMLKLASQKGYLTDPNAKKSSGQSLEHLKNTRATKMENERFDIEDKYVKKLERMGTTGSGPARSFIEKKDYNPELVIEYVDEKGREMEPKDAFRVMSWKFHGKRPGKKQIEKRSNRLEKKELMKKMDSWDTPLGTLNKQLKKQEQMQTPYLVLSNTGKQTELKKD